MTSCAASAVDDTSLSVCDDAREEEEEEEEEGDATEVLTLDKDEGLTSH